MCKRARVKMERGERWAPSEVLQGGASHPWLMLVALQERSSSPAWGSTQSVWFGTFWEQAHAFSQVFPTSPEPFPVLLPPSDPSEKKQRISNPRGWTILPLRSRSREGVSQDPLHHSP